MVTVNGTLLKDQFNDSSITVTKAEVVLDGGINLLNTYLNTALSNLTGAAGSKTGTFTSAETGAILAMALQIYQKNYKNPSGASNVNISSLGISYSTDMQMLEFAEKLAAQLNVSVATGDPPIWVSNDPVPTE